ncbi:unnamed protein product, partial [Symbiodinium necroappetens]
HLFFWCNKLMGFVVIKSHLATLEKAFQKPLGSRVLDVLLLLFGLSLITATVLYVPWAGWWVRILGHENMVVVAALLG